jgi:hypothetical protein
MGRVILNYRHSTPASIPATLEPMHVTSFSALAFMGMMLSIIGEMKVFSCRRTIPRQLLLALVPLTVLLYGVYLSARCPAVRYFIPIVFIWQAFLPLQLFDLIAGLRFQSLRTEAARVRARQLAVAVVVLLLVGSQLAFLLDDARLKVQQSGVVSRR